MSVSRCSVKTWREVLICIQYNNLILMTYRKENNIVIRMSGILKVKFSQDITIYLPNLRYGCTTGSPIGVVHRTGSFSKAITCLWSQHGISQCRCILLDSPPKKRKVNSHYQGYNLNTKLSEAALLTLNFQNKQESRQHFKRRIWHDASKLNHACLRSMNRCTTAMLREQPNNVTRSPHCKFQVQKIQRCLEGRWS